MSLDFIDETGNLIDVGEFRFAPKNDITSFLATENNGPKNTCIGFIDSTKKGENIINPSVVDNSCKVVIYSPNYWQEISRCIGSVEVYILELGESSLFLKKIDNFNGYSVANVIYKNTLIGQKMLWGNHLNKHLQSNLSLEKFGYEWGDPEAENDPLGNYLYVKDYLLDRIDDSTTLIEIGTLGGKWTKYFLGVEKLICVDINKHMIDAVSNRYSEYLNKIEFYISRGNELSGIDANSVDLVFSIDTLVRVNPEYIYDYIKESARVLKPNGELIFHLPDNSMQGSLSRNFVNLNISEVEKISQRYFKKIKVDRNTLNHGCLLFAKGVIKRKGN